jgi:crotonobetainyl-CoA:carnitine CoA-transferase CaiB-like acyl-CoA transferase
MVPIKNPKPLQGRRVVEFGTGYVAPVASMYLRLLGAEIVKIEHRQNPDFMRGDVRAGTGLMASFLDVNRGKRSVAIDAKTDSGRALVLGLLERSDVLVENFGGGAMRRLGLSYPSVRAVKGDIVMASLQGLGADVEHSTTLGQNIPPLIGLTYLWNHPGAERPVGSQLFHPDYFAGVYGAALILAALDHRRRTGSGHFIDSAQAEVAASLLGPWYLACETNNVSPRPVGNSGLRGVPAGCYRCKGDDEWCVIVIRDDADWRALKSVIGAAAWIGQKHFDSIIGRLRNRDALERELGAWTRTQSAWDLMTKLQGQGVPCGTVQQVVDLVKDGQLNSQGFIRPLDQLEANRTMVGGIPLAFDGADIDATERCPMIGEHTVSVLKEWLELQPDEIERLRADRVIDIGSSATSPA